MATLIGLFLLAATLMGPFVVRPAAPAPPPPTSPPVTLLALPNSGVQPQAVTDPQGTLHVVYFKGEAMGGDLFYIRRAPGAVGFSRPARVNSVTGSAMASKITATSMLRRMSSASSRVMEPRLYNTFAALRYCTPAIRR